MLNAAKTRALTKKLDFSISKEDIIIPLLCPILKKPLICGTKEDYNFSPSLDRLDNTKGYTKENTIVMSKRANTMKNSATRKELLLFADWIYKTFK